MPKLKRSQRIPETPEIPRWDVRYETSGITVVVVDPGSARFELTLSIDDARSLGATLLYMSEGDAP